MVRQEAQIGRKSIICKPKSITDASQLVALHFKLESQISQFGIANCDMIPLILYPVGTVVVVVVVVIVVVVVVVVVVAAVVVVE